jgi:formylglycine-generating enzyme required for sulfatase activity
MALAGFAPSHELSEAHAGEAAPAAWTEADATLVTEQLLASNPELQGEIRKALRPIASLLLEDLERSLLDETLEKLERNAAATAVADYAGGESERLARLLPQTTPEPFRILYAAFEKVVNAESRAGLATQVATLPLAEMEPEPRIAFGRERANAATTLLRLGEREAALKVCDMTDDPEALTQFLFACRPRGVPVGTLLACLDQVTAAPAETYGAQVWYALLIALGEYPSTEIPEAERERRIEQVAGWYLNDPSSTVHGACGWLLRQWGAAPRAEEIERTEVKYESGREWYTEVIEVQPVGEQEGEKPPKQNIAMTFIVFPAGEYQLGSAEGQTNQQFDEIRHTVKLTRAFALLDRELTFAECLMADPESEWKMEALEADPSDPVAGPTWYEAVEYCRWLGSQRGLQEAEQSYAAPDSAELKGLERDASSGFRKYPRDWPVRLGRRGYRLPTEAEWEVAVRSIGRVAEREVVGRTAYGFGGDMALLERFAWYRANSGEGGHLGRGRIPGLRGVWDMHGGQLEWVHDIYGLFGRASQSDPTGKQNGVDAQRGLRGGSWLSSAVGCRSASRNAYRAGDRLEDAGFRLTVLPGPSEQ